MKKFLFAAFLFLTGTVFAAAAVPSVKVPEFAAPLAIKLDGIPDEPFWKKASPIDDFHRFRRPGTPVKAKTTVKFCADDKNLYAAIVCHEPKGISKGKAARSLWGSDHVDMIFSVIDGKDWYLQIAFSYNGKSYHEFITPQSYRKAFHVEKNLWSVELVIPRSCFGKFTADTLRFNMLRYRSGAGESQSWAKLDRWALEPDKFGKLLFVPVADEIVHGPWNSSVSADSAVISWESASAGKGTLHFRKAGDKKFSTRTAVTKGDKKVHHVRLEKLSPGTLYEYHAGDGKIRSFRTLDPKSADFTFAFTTDIHGDNVNFKKLLNLPAVRKADFLFLGGDLITGITGRYSCYNAFLDTLSANWPKAAYYFRGNHEYRGITAPFLELTAPFSGKSYGAFFHKGVFFLFLDTGDDSTTGTPYMKEQYKFLDRVLRSPEFRNARYRILMAHQPLIPSKNWTSGELRALYAVMEKNQAHTKIDLMLSGHIHSCNRMLKGEKQITSSNPRINGRKVTRSFPFPIFVNDKCGVILVDVRKGQLETTILDSKFKVFEKRNFPVRK